MHHHKEKNIHTVVKEPTKVNPQYAAYKCSTIKAHDLDQVYLNTPIPVSFGYVNMQQPSVFEYGERYDLANKESRVNIGRLVYVVEQ